MIFPNFTTVWLCDRIKVLKPLCIMPYSQDSILKNFSEQIRGKFGERIINLKLFGSRARGDARPDSDYDVLLVLDRVTEADRDVVADVVGEMIQRHEQYVSCNMYSQDEFARLNAPPTPFMQIIQHEWISLWS